MKTWHRHLVLWGKAKREGRIGHRHRWWKRDETFGNTQWTCFCGKVVTSYDIMAAGDANDAAKLFFPIVPEQLDSIFDTQFFRR